MKKKLASVLLCAVMAASMLTGCGNSGDAAATTPATDSKTDAATTEAVETTAAADGSVYYLNFKPEVDEVWQKLAKEYTEETGVPVKVVTAASGTYEQTLMSEIANKEAPTLFQINGPIGYQNWKDYCADLKDTDLYSWLMDKSLAITGEDGGVYGIPYVVEGYGIIYNDAIMQKYFALDGAKAASMDEINNFAKLKEVVEDMQAKKDELGIEGVFASTSLTPGEDWRWQTHLANIPVYYEFKDKGITDTDNLEFTYSDNFKNIFDLYINNSCTAPGLLGSKSVDDSMAEFALGQAAMVQNGNWGWSQINGVEGNTVKAEDVKFLPIYTGVEGEENQGLCTGTENYWCVNKDASEEDIAATLAFMNWCVTDGAEAMANDMGFVIPFDTAAESTNLFVKQDVAYTAEGKTPVSWNFSTMPSEEWKNVLGSALTAYAADQTDANWDAVVSAFVDNWAAEYKLQG